MPDATPTPTNAPPRLAVFASGGGRTFGNLHDRIRAGALRAEIVVLVASSHCGALAKASERGVPSEVHPGEIPADRLASILAPYRPDYLVLAGYLKKLHIPRGFEGRVVNIHPALLPRHGGPGMYGRRVHEAVLAAGDTESGCTVHLCDDEYDRGEIIVQRRCPVLADDTPDTLAARVFAEECEAYPAALTMLFENRRPPSGV
ncbi:MAG: phosphoribosylglycinamide formyltransferase [Planctomycetota bacterium]|nr:phosphoribosylglycinamide formyltransferase [Planctomycetota bacterium]